MKNLLTMSLDMVSIKNHGARRVCAALLLGALVAQAQALVTAADVTRDGMNALKSPGSEGKALSLFERAAKMGDADAAFQAGLMHMMGRGPKRDDAMAAQYFKSAALKGHAHAQYEYAEALMDGRGVG
jgi:TPR repeat protein